MADLYLPTSRRGFRDRHAPSPGYEDVVGEVDLVASAQDIIVRGKPVFDALLHFCCQQNDIVWFPGRDVYVVTSDSARDGNARNQLSGVLVTFEDVLRVHFRRDDTSVFSLILRARSVDESTKMACDLLLQLLAVAQGKELSLLFADESDDSDAPFSNVALSRLVVMNQSLETLELCKFSVDRDFCHALGFVIRPDLQTRFRDCNMTESGSRAVAEAIHSHQGPTWLLNCDMDHSLLAEALRGNTSLTHFESQPGRGVFRDDDEWRLFARALSQACNLLIVSFEGLFVNDENLEFLCQHIARHPTLECLNLVATTRDEGDRWFDDILTERKIRRATAVLEMLRFNTVLRRIELCPYEFDSGILDHEIRPRLEMNDFRPRVRSLAGIQDDASDCDLLLGSTLDEVNGTPTLMLMLLRSNPNLVDRLRR